MSRKAEMGRMRPIGPMRPISPMRPMSLLGLLLGLLSLTGCYREPPLHLYDPENIFIEMPFAEVRLDLYWDYKDNLGINYDWRAEWYYGMDDENGPGWDDEDKRIFGELEYVEPSSFQLRRYYTGDTELGKRLYRLEDRRVGRTFRGAFEWGYWDLLAWNDITTIDGVQSLRFDEPADIEKPVIAYTGEDRSAAVYRTPRYQMAYYEPEQLFAASDRGIGIHRDLRDFYWNEEEGKWIRELSLYLEPITYIYLPQVILHNNRGRINLVPGMARLTGMAGKTSLNTGIADTTAVAVAFKMRMKNHKKKLGEDVDIIGGRLMTFGICGQNANRITRTEESFDGQHHTLDLLMQFYNGTDSTFVFDVTDQVRKRFKGGVITVELDMDTVPIPRRKGGSGFEAVIEDYEDGGTYEFDM